MASVDSIGQTSSTTDPTSTSGATSSANSQQNEFLQLLVAQLQTQNPLDPMDGTQFVSQLAQFSSLQGIDRYAYGSQQHSSDPTNREYRRCDVLVIDEFRFGAIHPIHSNLYKEYRHT